MQKLRLLIIMRLDKSNGCILSYYFTKNRPSKIFKIEKINRQTIDKNGLILPKKRSFQAKTMTLRSWKHTIEVL